MSFRKVSRAHVVFESVYPALTGDAAHPVRRVIGETVRTGADIYKDGYDLIGARLLHRGPASRAWRSVAMAYEFDPDHWFAEIRLDALGIWPYTIEAWPDTFATWQSDLRKRIDAGQDASRGRANP